MAVLCCRILTVYCTAYTSTVLKFINENRIFKQHLYFVRFSIHYWCISGFIKHVDKISMNLVRPERDFGK